MRLPKKKFQKLKIWLMLKLLKYRPLRYSSSLDFATSTTFFLVLIAIFDLSDSDDLSKVSLSLNEYHDYDRAPSFQAVVLRLPFLQ